MTTYFVTGATGVVGSALVPVLLEDPAAQLTLLIRARNAEELSSRLETLYDFWRIPKTDSRTRARVRALAGDTTLPQLGLSEEAYRALSLDCTHIIHAAGLVRMNLPLEDARRSAVGAAGNIVALARACPRLQKIEFVSTVGVGGRLKMPIPERWLFEPRAFHNTYEQAKAETEDYVRSELARAPLPLTIHRPSMVVGDSRDGHVISFQIFYFLCDFLSGRRTLGFYPNLGDARLDTIPCNVVAKAIALSSREADSAGRIFHLCSGPEQAIRMDDLRDEVRRTFAEHGFNVPRARVLPRRLFVRLAEMAAKFAPAAQRKSIAALPIYLDYLADQSAFENSAFLAWSTDHGLEILKPTQYLPKLLRHYLEAR